MVPPMVPQCGEPERTVRPAVPDEGFGQRIFVSITPAWAAHSSDSLVVDSAVA